MFVIASLDEMFITALLDRQAKAVIAVGLLLDLVVVVGNTCYTATLVILVLFELATGESYYGIPNTIRLLARTHSIETLLTLHIIRNISLNSVMFPSLPIAFRSRRFSLLSTRSITKNSDVVEKC